MSWRSRFAEKEGKGYFKDAEAVCISDNYWLGTEKPCLTYGLRGVNYYSIEVSGPGADLHSGVFGGMAQEPMTMPQARHQPRTGWAKLV